MSYINHLFEGTTMLYKAVGVLQNTRWDCTQEEARQFLVSMDMDITFAASLVADMEADGFGQKMQTLHNGHKVTTIHKSIALWVRKYGFDASLAHTGDIWVICPGGNWGAVNWNQCDWSHGAWMEPMHPVGRQPGFRCGGCIGVGALVIAGLVFVGIWMFTGDLWAAILMFEVIFDILLEIADMFY